MEGRQELLARWIQGGTAAQGYIVAPASGATVTLWDSGSNEGAQQLQGQSNVKGVRFKRLIINVYSSAASAANGLQVDESHDNGANWDNVISFPVSATTLTKNIVSVNAPRLRVRYVNSANTLSQWRGSVIGDEYERSSQ